MRILAATLFLAGVSLGANLAAPNDAGVAWGHFHFLTRNLDQSRKFWTMLGATPAKPMANNDVFLVRNSLIFVKQAEPLGGSEATLVNHIGFKIKDLDGVLAKVREAGYKVVQPAEAIAKSHKCNVIGPDDLNVELVGDPQMEGAIASHHVHFYNTPIEDTRAWYVKTFGAVAGKRDVFEAADLPGINLSFSAAKGPVKPTKGYAADHIGFEVRNLEAFCRKLEAAGVKFDRPFTKVPALGVSLAFFTDPFGTYIELTEGLGSIQ